MNNPNLFIVGPPKCASTSLYHYLQQHPQISLSQTKETHFFSLNYSDGVKSYLEGNFNGIENDIIGEADPTYSFLTYPLKHIKEHFPEAKLIYTLRNPVERAFSGWSMRMRQGHEKLSFREAIKKNAEHRKNFTFLQKNAENKWVHEHRQIKTSDKLSIPTYIEAGLYAEMLDFAFSLFPRDQIKLIQFEDLKTNLSPTLKEIFGFLQIDENIEIKDLVHTNVYKKSYLQNIRQLFGTHRVKKIADHTPKRIKEMVRNTLNYSAEKPQLSLEDRKFAYQFFKKDIDDLEKLLNQSFEKWKIN